MKYLLYLCLILSSFAEEDKDARVKYYPLDRNLGFTVYCSPDSEVPTTIDFPSEITEILKTKVLSAGDEVSETDFHKYPFTIERRPGSNYFSVYSRGIIGDKAAINVVYNGEHFMIDFETAKNADRVVYYREKITTGDLFSDTELVTRDILISQMDKVKSYHLHDKSSFEGAIYHPAKSKYDRTDYVITIDEVFMISKLQTLYFRVVIDNKTKDRLEYNPQTFGVNVGSLNLINTLSQANGFVPPLGQSIGWYAFSSDGRGKPLKIDPRKNTFIPLLKVLKANQYVVPELPKKSSENTATPVKESSSRKIRRIRVMREMKPEASMSQE
jgi:hypothetical protein